MLQITGVFHLHHLSLSNDLDNKFERKEGTIRTTLTSNLYHGTVSSYHGLHEFRSHRRVGINYQKVR